jgi:hypothetical protein
VFVPKRFKREPSLLGKEFLAQDPERVVQQERTRIKTTGIGTLLFQVECVVILENAADLDIRQGEALLEIPYVPAPDD